MKKIAIFILACAMLIMSLCLVACDSKVEFKVDFVVDGEIYSTINTSGKEVIAIPKNPTKDGYEFDGWYWDDGKWQKPFTANSLLYEPLSSNMSVYAKWNEIQPEPAPELSGVDISSADLTVSGETVTATIPNATQTFSFLNDITIADGATYILSKDIGCENTIASKTVALEEGDNTFYLLVTNGNAQRLYTVTIRRRPMYTVEFNTNDGTILETIHIEENSNVKMQEISKKGYTFDGWTLNGENVAFPYVVKDNIIFKAKYTAISYKIEYNLNNGTNNHENVSNYTIEQTVALKNPTRDCYTFDGWYENERFEGPAIERIEIGSNGNKKFCAKWKPIQYEIKYELNNGTNNENNVLTYNTEQEITLYEPIKDGYVFLGWFTESTFDNKIEKIGLCSNGNKKFYAKWQANENTLIFNANGGEGIMSNITIYTDASAVLTQNTFIREHHTFIGWATTADGEVKYQDGDNYTMGADNSYTLYAVWKATEYTITYQKNGGTGGDNNPVTFTIYDLPIKLTDLNNTKNQLFNYWYTESDFSGNPVFEITEVGDITLYAEFVEGTKDLIFKENNGSYSITGYTGTANEVIIPKLYKGKAVTSIGDSAFYKCTILTSVSIPNSITNIGNDAFYGCTILTIYCESKSKPSGWDADWNNSYCPVVWDCNNNDVANDGYIYKTVGGINYGLKGNTAKVVRQSKSITRATILAKITYNEQEYRVTSIDDWAFSFCENLASITIPNSVTNIGENAFIYCISLKSVFIPNSVTTIGEGAFELCNSLTIYCEAIEKPNGWNSLWNRSKCPVNWGW